MKYPTKADKQARAARFMKAIDPKKVRTDGSFFNNWGHIDRRVEEAKAKGLVPEVTDAWGEMGTRGYSVIWTTPRANIVPAEVLAFVASVKAQEVA